AAGSTSLLFLFLVLGVLRSYGGELGATKVFRYSSEFESLFGNAFDIWRLKKTGIIGSLPATFYLSDFLALIPQQLLTIQKISPSVWYLNTFYPDLAASGVGLAFGSVSESLVGLGWPDLIVRGAVLGLLFGRIHALFTRRPGSFWVLAGYIWTCVLA